MDVQRLGVGVHVLAAAPAACSGSRGSSGDACGMWGCLMRHLPVQAWFQGVGRPSGGWLEVYWLLLVVSGLGQEVRQQRGCVGCVRGCA